MPDTEVTYYKRGDRVKPVTKRELEAIDGLADTLKAQGWTKATAADVKAAGFTDDTKAAKSAGPEA